MSLRLIGNLLCGVLVLSPVAQLHAGERADFVAAERAYAAGDSAEYKRLKQRLADYPLFQYLEYRELRGRLSTASPARISRFLDTYPDTPLAARLRKAWLKRLADENRWTDYARFFDPDDSDVTRRCHYLDALIRTGRKREAFAEVPAIWQHGHSRPEACNPVFDAWRGAGHLTTELAWARIALAMDSGSTRLARYLGRYLPSEDQRWLKLWLQLHEKPAEMLSGTKLSGSHPLKKAMVGHGIKRLARTNHVLAVTLWRRYRSELAFTENEACPVDERLAIILEDESGPLVYRFFEEVEPCRTADRLQEARIRAGLMRRDWPAVARWIDALPDEHRSDERWLYWKGRALEATGRKEEAETLFREAAAERTYYGFLAADRVDAPYRHDHVPLSVPDDLLDRVRKKPAVQRMSELYALGRIIDARREWFYLVTRLDDAELRATARLLADWDWIDRAIFTAARARYWDDLELRFPLRHKALVDRYADERRLDPAWVFGVLRQESAFTADVRSSAGAVGLMQLMPATARRVATAYRMPTPSTDTLIDPETNIALGTGYLRMMMDDLASNRILATAAYNAGPHRVKRWLPPAKMDADIWVELIPFRETRLYVQRVMAYAAIYEQRLGGIPTRLSTRMRHVRATG